MSGQLHRALRFAEVEPFSPHELAAHCDGERHVALLENPGVPSELGCHAYFCRAPFWVFRSEGARCWAGPPGAERELDGDPLDQLGRLLSHWRAGGSTWVEGLPPFCGGAIGWLGYEVLHLIEEVPAREREVGSLPDIELALFDLVFATDLIERRSFVIATGFGDTLAQAETAAAERLDEGQRALARWRALPPRAAAVEPLRARATIERTEHPRLHASDLAARGITPTIDRSGYLASIERIQQEILDGNTFEVCLTQRFDVDLQPGELDPSARELYEVLRAVNPAPMSAYLRVPAAEILSASPERFLELDRSGMVETRPIKGTRPRGRSEAEDLALAEHLRTAEKDRAENLMIVDLCRNDLGKVARFGSVRVTELCGVHPYEFTWQMVSTIRAQLRDDLGPMELLRACFPGGSMTGAPKIEALKIIRRLEPTERGVFSGAIGLFDFDGAMDLSIVIRTLIRTGRRLSFHVGGAIVADSDPAEEYQETLDKAHGLVLALDLARARAREREREGG